MELVAEKYKQTEVGLIPSDWELKELGDVGDVKMCRRVFNNETSSSGSIPFYKIGTFGNEPDAFISNELYNEYRQRFSFPKKGDILISAAGTIGRTIIYNGEDAYFQDSNIVWIDNNQTIISNDFLYHTLQVVKYNTEGGTIQRLYNSILKATKFVCPTKAEQTRIATALSDADALISSLEKLIEKKRAIKQGAMQELVKPKEGWVVKKLGELTKVFTKQTGFDYTAYIKPSLVQHRTDDTIPFIQNKDFNNRWINFNTDYFIPKSIAIQFPKILLNEKSLLISISGSVGNVGVYDSKELAFIGGAVSILKFKESDLIDWVMLYLKSNEGQKKLLDNVKAGSHQNLILDDIRKIEIPFPPKVEQARIATILSDMDTEINALETKLEKYRKMKMGMMQNLLTGKIRLI